MGNIYTDWKFLLVTKEYIVIVENSEDKEQPKELPKYCSKIF